MCDGQDGIGTKPIAASRFDGKLASEWDCTKALCDFAKFENCRSSVPDLNVLNYRGP